MNRITMSLSALILTASLALAAGCEDKNKPAAPVKPTDASSSAPKHDDHAHDKPGDKHDHADGDKHDDHDHAHGDGSDLGSVTIGGFALKVSQEGKIEEGKDAGFEIELAEGAAKPTTLRAWIGTEDAKGSVKAKAEAETHGFHLHAEVPKPIPANAKLWMEVEASDGKKSVGSIALKR